MNFKHIMYGMLLCGVSVSGFATEGDPIPTMNAKHLATTNTVIRNDATMAVTSGSVVHLEAQTLTLQPDASVLPEDANGVQYVEDPLPDDLITAINFADGSKLVPESNFAILAPTGKTTETNGVYAPVIENNVPAYNPDHVQEKANIIAHINHLDTSSTLDMTKEIESLNIPYLHPSIRIYHNDKLSSIKTLRAITTPADVHIEPLEVHKNADKEGDAKALTWVSSASQLAPGEVTIHVTHDYENPGTALETTGTLYNNIAGGDINFEEEVVGSDTKVVTLVEEITPSVKAVWNAATATAGIAGINKYYHGPKMTWTADQTATTLTVNTGDGIPTSDLTVTAQDLVLLEKSEVPAEKTWDLTATTNLNAATAAKGGLTVNDNAYVIF